MGFKDLYKQKPEMPPRVACSESHVSVSTTRDEVTSITWDSLETVRIVTSTEGPAGGNSAWVLTGADGTVLRVPSQAKGMARLLERLHQLPGFDANAILAAMTCTDEEGVLAWQR